MVLRRPPMLEDSLNSEPLARFEKEEDGISS